MMDLRQAPEKVYQYELRFQAEYHTPSKKKGQPDKVTVRDLARGPRNE